MDLRIHHTVCLAVYIHLYRAAGVGYFRGNLCGGVRNLGGRCGCELPFCEG